MSHPPPGELIELFFGELEGGRAEACAAHARECSACRDLLADVESAECALRAGPDDAPPPDGLARVLARIEAVPPVRVAQAHWFRTAAPCAAAFLAGAVAVVQGGAVAALALLALGSIVTLALAPVLILESQRRS
jgi:predicted anti-sigma-YlaC factor YlaD